MQPVKYAKQLLLWCLLLPVMAATQAKEPIPLFEADYTLKRGNFAIGTMHRSLRKEKNHYVFESSAKPKGLLSLFSSHRIHEKSIWTFENGRIISQEFSYTSGSKKKQKQYSIHFDSHKRMVHGKDRKRAWQLEYPNKRPVFDRANYQISLMQDMRNNSSELQYLFIKRGRIKDYRFERLGREIIKTPAGQYRTVKVQRKQDKRGTTIWLAPSLDYAPVKIEQIEKDGTLYQLLLKKFTRTAAH